jgi:hypothetical protein
VVGSDNVTLIVADETDRLLLPRTFEQLLGVPEGLLQDRGERANTSMTYAQVELLRQLNIVFHDHGWEGRYVELVRRGVLPALLEVAPTPGDAKVPPLPAWAWRRLVELSDQRIDDLSALSVQVVGNVEELRLPSVAPDPHRAATEVISVPVATAVAALQGLAAAAEKRQQVSPE